MGAGTLVRNTADANTAVGIAASLLNTTATQNVAVGAGAMVNNNADDNTAVGGFALENNVAAVTNVAVGVFAAQNNDSSGAGTADFNVAVGGFALQGNVGGARNTAVGAGALESFTGGDDNTAIGERAGGAYTDGTETNNICIGSGTEGTAGENNAIRIGDASTSGGIDVLDGGSAANFVLIGTNMGSQGIAVASIIGFGTVQIGNGLSTTALASSCNIGGIYNQSFGPADMAVRVGSDNKLGTVVSSRRFKHDIKPMDNASEAVLALKPVTFHYKSDNTNTPRFGLIAEDVAEVSPELVIPDKEGKPLSVRYEDVNVMLLNEFLKEHKKVEDQQASISQLKSEMQTMVAQLKEQAAQIQKVSAQLQVGKPAPQIVVNKP
ncbi:MAG TPA: tail fiber domain-containing protein [Candidatus Udaeobacter sp.]|nr:tail fiber domain-containing protein [Candidatus Udaeobacter sp.]